MTTHYETLGVNADATLSAIRIAYFIKLDAAMKAKDSRAEESIRAAYAEAKREKSPKPEKAQAASVKPVTIEVVSPVNLLDKHKENRYNDAYNLVVEHQQYLSLQKGFIKDFLKTLGPRNFFNKPSDAQKDAKIAACTKKLAANIVVTVGHKGDIVHFSDGLLGEVGRCHTFELAELIQLNLKVREEIADPNKKIKIVKEIRIKPVPPPSPEGTENKVLTAYSLVSAKKADLPLEPKIITAFLKALQPSVLDRFFPKTSSAKKDTALVGFNALLAVKIDAKVRSEKNVVFSDELKAEVKNSGKLDLPALIELNARVQLEIERSPVKSVDSVCSDAFTDNELDCDTDDDTRSMSTELEPPVESVESLAAAADRKALQQELSGFIDAGLQQRASSDGSNTSFIRSISQGSASREFSHALNIQIAEYLVDQLDEKDVCVDSLLSPGNITAIKNELLKDDYFKGHDKDLRLSPALTTLIDSHRHPVEERKHDFSSMAQSRSR